jgi:hypothetical protein
MSTAGALFLAHERQSLKVSDDEVVIIHPPDRWPITDCMTDRAFAEWVELFAEYGLTH